MPKISSFNLNSLFIKYAVKIAVSTVVSVILLNAIISFILLKLDIDLSVCRYCGVFVCAVSSFIISYFSVGGFKNNLVPLAFVSVLPLMIFTLINHFVNNGEAVILIIKLFLIILSAFLSSVFSLKRKKR
ncbi:MAG: hypothetical protein ACI4RR_01575 [Eubacterium sp.]